MEAEKKMTMMIRLFLGVKTCSALTCVRYDITGGGSSRIRHFVAMHRNFMTKLVTTTAHNTAQKSSGSMFGLRKMRLTKKTAVSYNLYRK